MSKIVGLVVTVLLINVAMFVFTFSGDCPDGGCNLEDYNVEGGDQNIWDYFTNPQNQSSSNFWGKLFSTSIGLIGALTAAGAAVFIGTVLVRDINVAYITLMGFLIGGTVGTYVNLWIKVNANSLLGSASNGAIVMILVGTLLAAQLFNAIDWGRAKD